MCWFLTEAVGRLKQYKKVKVVIHFWLHFLDVINPVQILASLNDDFLVSKEPFKATTAGSHQVYLHSYVSLYKLKRVACSI